MSSSWILLLTLLGSALLPLCVRAQSPNYEDKCRENVDNATLLFAEGKTFSHPDGSPLAPGDTLALRTDAGTCVGYAGWNDEKTSVVLAAAGPSAVQDVPGGYETGDPLSLEIYAGRDRDVRHVGTHITYAACDTLAVEPCADDGLYENEVVLVVDSLAREPTLAVSNMSATYDGEHIVLEWALTETQNEEGFEVQHWTTTEDDSSWSTVKFVEHAEDSSLPAEYEAAIEAPEIGTHRYRLRQMDGDGRASVSQEIEVDVTLTAPYKINPIVPHPVQSSGRLEVGVREPQDVSVSVYNILGQHVATVHDGPVPANELYKIRVQTRRWASGQYFLRIRGDIFEETQRMMIVH